MITLKSDKQIQTMREGAKILSAILGELKREIKPGVSTKHLEFLYDELLIKNKVESNFKGYGGYPSSICLSVNDMVVHGVPNDYKLQHGDIISIDTGLFYKGYHADMAISVPVGQISQEANKLIKTAKQALIIGIREAKAGNTFGDVGWAIQNYVESQGFSVIRDLCGHGIGKNLHEDPQILNYGKKRSGPAIKKGMVFCLEPMIALGDWRIAQASDGFGYKTKDGSLAAHFEHMVAVGNDGTEVLTEFK